MASQKKVLHTKIPHQITDAQEKFEALFQDVHKFIDGKAGLRKEDKTISWEILLKENYLHYHIVSSDPVIPVLKSLLFGTFKEIEITEGPLDRQINFQKALLTEFKLNRSNFFPIKTRFSGGNDPVVTISAVLSKFEHFN